ncbi:hypothetical protein F5Y10DRAFT_269107 [Nemania abortiva]|nr:hypothetical protein F5Y10DRAFT_269107 [Nemania abortiva]
MLGYEVDRFKVSRPALVLGYVENGSIQDLCKRMAARKIRAPNRSIEFSIPIIRTCAGFAYPPWNNGDRELIPADGIKKHSSTIHNDLHDEDVLIECHLTINTGCSRETADQKNIQEAARIITGVVAMKYSTLRDENMEVDILDETGTVRKIIGYTDPALNNSTYLLPALNYLLPLCQTANRQDRPSPQCFGYV